MSKALFRPSLERCKTHGSARKIQSYADKHDFKRFFSALKALHSPWSTGTSFLLSAVGNTLITEKGRILDRWAEHFKTMLNRQPIINDDAMIALIR